MAPEESPLAAAAADGCCTAGHAQAAGPRRDDDHEAWLLRGAWHEAREGYVVVYDGGGNELSALAILDDGAGLGAHPYRRRRILLQRSKQLALFAVDDLQQRRWLLAESHYV
uniref:Uncharacterized protein n=1 Tax=Oryza meridionalis TaxID=40149 RepID=A0A0E0CCN5_9ORYZ